MEEVDFGFFFCRVLHFYSISHLEVMKLPLKTFWLMSANVDRIMAQNDLRNMSIATMSNATEDCVENYRQRLVVETGTVVKLESENPLNAQRDEAGFAFLKTLS